MANNNIIRLERIGISKNNTKKKIDGVVQHLIVIDIDGKELRWYANEKEEIYLNVEIADGKCKWSRFCENSTKLTYVLDMMNYIVTKYRGNEVTPYGSEVYQLYQ